MPKTQIKIKCMPGTRPTQSPHINNSHSPSVALIYNLFSFHFKYQWFASAISMQNWLKEFSQLSSVIIKSPSLAPKWMSIHAPYSSLQWSSLQLRHVMLRDVPDSSSCSPLCIYFLGGSLVPLSLVLHVWSIPLSTGSHCPAFIGSSSLFLLIDQFGLDPLGAPLDSSSPLALSWRWSLYAVSANALFRASCAPIHGVSSHRCTSDKLRHLVGFAC